MTERYRPESSLAQDQRVSRRDLLSSDLAKLVQKDAKLASQVGEFDTIKTFDQLVELQPEKLNQGFALMVERVAAETNIIQEIQDTVGKENILRNPGERSFPVTVEFGLGDKSWNAADSQKSIKTEGGYSSKENKILMSEEEPSKRRLWFMMTYAGMPHIVRTLDHELNHYWVSAGKKTDPKIRSKIRNFVETIPARFFGMACGQALALTTKILNYDDKTSHNLRMRLVDAGFKIIGKLTNSFGKALKAPRLEGEIIAQKAGRVFDKRENTTSSLVKTLVDSYGYNSASDIDRIIITSQVCDRLKALGFNHKDIAIKITQARYDKRTVSFPSLEKEIQEMAFKEGLTVNDLDTITDIARVESEIENHKAAIIAREELESLGSEN